MRVTQIIKRSVVACLIFLTVGCQQGQTSRQLLRVQIHEDPESLDPREVRSIGALTICKMLYDGLTRVDAQGKAVLSLAKSVEVSEDGITYTFNLRKSLWSNGHPVTAGDFVAAWNYALCPEHPVPLASLFSIITSFEACDTHTLVVTLKEITPYFLELVANPVFFPMPSEKGATNGPFQLESMTANSELRLLKNPNYWDADAVHLDGIQLLVIPDDLTALEMLRSGEVDWVGSPLGGIPTDLLMHVDRLASYPVAATLWYKLNTRRPPLDNPKFRRALAYAIDREAIVRYVAPLGQPIATSPVPNVMSQRHHPCFQDHNIELAKSLFDEVEEKPKLTLLVGDGLPRKIAQAIQQQWREVLGLEVELQSVDFKMLLTQVQNGDYDIAGKIWFADFNDPTNFLDMYGSRDDLLNETGWEHPHFAHLLQMAHKEVDIDRRRAYLEEAEELFVSEMPVIPIYYHAMSYVKNEHVADVPLPPVGWADFKWARVN